VRTRTQFGKRAFSVCSQKVWNQVPGTLTLLRLFTEPLRLVCLLTLTDSVLKCGMHCPPNYSIDWLLLLLLLMMMMMMTTMMQMRLMKRLSQQRCRSPTQSGRWLMICYSRGWLLFTSSLGSSPASFPSSCSGAPSGKHIYCTDAKTFQKKNLKNVTKTLKNRCRTNV